MSMNREEAINRIENHMEVHGIGEYPHIALKEALDMAITALRPVSREKVKKAEWIWSTGDVYICSSCGEKTHVDECMGTPIYNFCPFCGTAQTDEAVEMVMKRLEAMKDGKSN